MTESDPKQMRQILADLRGFDKEKRRTAVMRLGMVGGGEGAFIGAVHRIAARLDDRYELVTSHLKKTIADMIDEMRR